MAFIQNARTIQERKVTPPNPFLFFPLFHSHTLRDLVRSLRYKNFKLPGLDNYTPEQLFFISFGRQWCSKTTPERAVRQLHTDVHSPARVRIHGPIQNSPDFAKAFNCPSGSPMNPVKKCEVW
jgi:predicted metalloendopeptidase